MGSQKRGHRRTQTHVDIFPVKGCNVCVFLCESVANHIRNGEVGKGLVELTNRDIFIFTAI